MYARKRCRSMPMHLLPLGLGEVVRGKSLITLAGFCHDRESLAPLCQQASNGIAQEEPFRDGRIHAFALLRADANATILAGRTVPPAHTHWLKRDFASR